MTFAAKFPGKCSACGDWFAEGVTLTRDAQGYRHADCNDADDPSPVTREVCRRCWLEKSVTGECGCDA